MQRTVVLAMLAATVVVGLAVDRSSTDAPALSASELHAVPDGGLTELGPVVYASGSYGCNQSPDNGVPAASGLVGASDAPVCHDGNQVTSEFEAACLAGGLNRGFIGTTGNSAELSGAFVTVINTGGDIGYITVQPQAGVTIIEVFVKGGSDHNHYFGDLIGLHSPKVGNSNGGNGTIPEISHWGVCYQITV